MPVVSILVPNYNHARFLRRRIDSILAQTFQDFELILLDDCSTDDSQLILLEYASDPRVRVEFNDVNSGNPFKQWNKGVRLAQGKYIWMAESDDYADERLLERLVAVLEADPQISFAYCQSRCVTEDDRFGAFAESSLDDAQRWAADFCEEGPEACRKFFLPYNPISNASAVVFRRDIYEQAGGADESLRLCGDWKLWAAMALCGRVAYLCEPLNYFRTHENSVRGKTRQARTDVTEFLHVARWILDRVTVTDAILEKTCDYRAELWVPALMSLSVPMPLKLKIWQDVRALDPHPIRRVARPALRVLRLKVLRHWRDLGWLLTSGRKRTRIAP